MRKTELATRNSHESGQTLVMVAFALIALIGFLAVAIDVGVLYSWRRDMQNAADAAALAGARVICMGGSQAEAITAAETYALDENRADSATVVIEGGNVVRVTANVTAPLFFARALGTNESGVTAQAAAVCGGTSGGSMIWPIALHQSLLEGKACGDEIIIIDSDKICDVHDCDYDGDGVPDVAMGGNRGWLDFARPDLGGLPAPGCEGNCGAAALKCWICNPIPILPSLPFCIKGEPGTMTTAFKHTDPTAAGTSQGCDDPIRYAKIPVFDISTDSGTCPPMDGQPLDTLGVSCPNQNLYRIVDYVCVRVERYESKYTNKDLGIKNEKALFVTIACDESNCLAPLSGVEGSFIPGGLSAVSLIE